MAAAKKSSRPKTPRKAAPKKAAAKRKPVKQAADKGARKAVPGKAAREAAAGTTKQSATKATKKAAAKQTTKPAAARAEAPKAKPAPAQAAAGPKAGENAPEFKLLDDAGRTRSLGEFRGRKVVLYFYPKDFTGGCTQQACDFRDNLSRITEKGAAVLGVSADSVDSHRRFKEKQDINYVLLSDPGREAIGSYGVWQEKSLYGRKFMGIVRSTFVIDEQGRISKVFPKVRVGGHVDEVLAAL